MPLVTKAERQDIRTLLSFPEGSAGSVMTTEYASVPADVAGGRRHRDAASAGPVAGDDLLRSTCWTRGIICSGFVSLRDLILAKPAAQVADLMQRDVISVRVDQDQEEAARTLAKYDFLALPVVDDQHRLVGIITHDDVIDVMIEEATEDAQQMGGIVPIDGGLPGGPVLHGLAEAGGLAFVPVHRRTVHVHGLGLFRERDRRHSWP